MPYSKILISVDGSPDSLFACEVAASLLEPASGGRVFHLLHCLEHVQSLLGGQPRKHILRSNAEAADAIFAKAVAFFESRGFVCKTHISDGDPGMEIARVAKELGCEVIVMGTRGNGVLKNLFLGSVSQSVLQHAAVPVLLANRALAKQE